MLFELLFVTMFNPVRGKDGRNEEETTAACCLRTPFEPKSCGCGGWQESLICHAVAALLGQGKG
jgi:hypothetical protein|tara:strand:+ start:196 stop:387 length:192 start_codon:yes stop_codon:yes gene_type:complete